MKQVYNFSNNNYIDEYDYILCGDNSDDERNNDDDEENKVDEEASTTSHQTSKSKKNKISKSTMDALDGF